MNEYQLDKHMVIEASAGTGKTYTITKIIAQIIRENRAKPENIVVVTYTEKAAGELKERIAKEFADTLKSAVDPQERARFEYAVKNIDEMIISTIHGFCNSLISEFAFENGEQFQSKLADDSLLLPKILHVYMRKKWFDTYEGRLPDLLMVSSFYSSPENFEKTVIQLANTIYSLADADTLAFKPSKMSTTEMIAKYTTVSGKIEELRNCRGFIRDTAAVKVKTKNVTSAKKELLAPLAELLFDDAEDNVLLSFLVKMKVIIKDLKKRLNPKKKNEESDEDRLLYGILVSIIGELELINGGLIVNTALELVKEVRQHKREAGLISFNDMLVLVNNALKNNIDFLTYLQKKYFYGLVDEFQDTDTVQWSIFRQLFLESKTNNRLFVIGDPKQAIYAFRNADVFTYFKATEDIVKQYDGIKKTLDTNYRSTESVVSGYNKLFSANGYFISKKMEYEAVNHCPPEHVKALPDKTELGMNIYKMNISESRKNIGSFRKEFTTFMISEIKKLLDGSVIRIKRGDGGYCIPDEGDICILTSKNKDSVVLEQMLQEHGIKSTIYKKAGLYQSDEAVSLYILLDALTEMSDKGKYKKLLLSDFFRLPASDIEKYDFEELEKIAQGFLADLKYLADKREWTSFFTNILEKTAVIYKSIRENPETAERKSANYIQLIELLEDEAFTARLDLRGVRDYLHSLTNNVVKAEMETDLHRCETEEKKVQIMTIHASKGLEFPIVFIYGALGTLKSRTTNYWTYHDDENIVYDLLKDANEDSSGESLKEKYDREQNEEARRVFYVAITRSQAMIYLPIMEKYEDEKGAKKGTKNNCPAETFLYDAVMPAGNLINGAILHSGTSCDSRELSLQERNEGGLAEDNGVLENAFFKENIKIDTEANPLFHNLTPEEFKRFFTIQSYSSIDRRSQADRKGKSSFFEYESLSKRKKNEVYTENDTGESEVAVLPPGAVTGNMLHSLLESIDYTKEVTESDERVIRAVERYFGTESEQQKEQYRKLTAAIITNVLEVELPEIHLKIKELVIENRKNELEFYLKLDEQGVYFINGFIDMIYRHKGKYYILDWKSNRLDSYRGESFRDEVKKHYQLQYDIYHLAAIDWLQSILREKFEYEKDFGGIVYIYMRGVGNGSDGVFFENADLSRYNELRKTLNSKIHKLWGIGGTNE